MPSDADVIRCASPWPGTAAQLLESLLSLGPGNWTVEHICAANAVKIAPGDALPILSGLAVAGACSRAREGATWSTDLNHAEVQRLVTLLRGAEHFRRLRTDAPSLELAVTMPMSPSHLENELPGSPGRPGGYLPTTSAFLRLAAAARSRLVVMMPFIDTRGFDWLRTVFRGAREEAQKQLILRDVEQFAVELSVTHADWLRAMDIGIFDYCVSHNRARALPIETFHAKIILADDRLAYVGSANILGSGVGTSLEAGFLVDGQAARQVTRLVDAILRVASAIR